MRAAGAFVWDFLAGDAPEPVLTTGAVIVLGLVLRHERMASFVLLPMVAALGLASSLWRERRRSARRGARASG
jgi:hypothetical protein